MERVQPITSIDAFKSLKATEIRAIYEKIVQALLVLKAAHTEKIAQHLGIEHAKVHKRTSELERLGVLYKTGAKLPMKSGRNAFVWSLTNPNQINTAKTEKILKGKTVSDYSKEIQKISQNPVYIQPELL